MNEKTISGDIKAVYGPSFETGCERLPVHDACYCTSYLSIEIKPHMEFDVWGMVIHVIHSL